MQVINIDDVYIFLYLRIVFSLDITLPHFFDCKMLHILIARRQYL
jgi:hypothetical protein